MNRRTAQAIHSTTNMAYWIENPNWQTGNRMADIALAAVRHLPLNVHESLKERFFDTDTLIAVNGESVVVRDGTDQVDKFMFCYPRKMALDAFREHVTSEVSTLTRHLAGIALPTTVAIKPARIFRNPDTQINTVAQTQTLLDLGLNTELEPDLLKTLTPQDRTARDLEHLLHGCAELLDQHGFYPDIANNGGNLWLNLEDGAVTLIDVMPFYEDGGRLVGSAPPNVIPHIQQNLAAYEEFVGQYGA